MLKIREVAAAEKGIVLIAGKSGLDSPVTRTHMVENLEIARLFISNNEMIFTTGAGLADENELIQLISAAHDSGACGIVVNIGPYIHSIPRNVTDYAEENALPLFSCPWEVRMAEIMHRISCRIDDSERAAGETAVLFKNAVLHQDGVQALRGLGFGENARFRVAATAEAAHILAEGAYSFEIGGSYITVFSFSDKGRIRSLLQNNSAAVSTECGISALGHACAEAKRLLALFREENAVRFLDESGIYQLLLGIEDTSLLESYRDTVLGPLLRHEAKKKSGLIAVLETYIACDSGLKEASAILGIHKNTVTNRIHKCEELLGADISRPEQRLTVEAALIVRRILMLEK